VCLTRVYRQRDLAAPLTVNAGRAGADDHNVVMVGNQVLSDSSTLDAGVFLLYLAVFSPGYTPDQIADNSLLLYAQSEASLVRIRSCWTLKR
jgi:hypothetical protein